MSKKLTCESGSTQTYMMDGSVQEDGIITVTVYLGQLNDVTHTHPYSPTEIKTSYLNKLSKSGQNFFY